MVVRSYDRFMQEINKLANQKRAKYFECRIMGNIFIVQTEASYRQFSFNLMHEAEAIDFIQQAIQILEKQLPRQLLLF
jgi:hypothetical protein